MSNDAAKLLPGEKGPRPHPALSLIAAVPITAKEITASLGYRKTLAQRDAKPIIEVGDGMLRRLVLAVVATSCTLAATDFDGNWVGLIERGNQPFRVSLILNSKGRSLSGTVAFGDGDATAIRHGRVFGDGLYFAANDADGNEVRFQLKPVDSLTIGQLVHKGEGLSGQALFAGDSAAVELPFHNRCTTPAVLLQSVHPEFTRDARRARIEGTVFLSVRIDASGQPADVQVVRGLGSGLDEKAIEALKKWQFQAAVREGTPVVFETIVAMHFRQF